jgi:hypothetical protein
MEPEEKEDEAYTAVSNIKAVIASEIDDNDTDENKDNGLI